MRKATFILAMMIALGAQGQNFVPNFSFEYKTACPVNNNCPFGGIDDFRKAEPWMSYSYSPDLYDPCVNGPNLFGNAPNTGFGYQNAFDGVGFAGFIFSRTDYNDNLFEILGCPLTEPLTIGQRYAMSIRVSLSDYRLNASNNIGILLLTQGYDGLTNPMPFPYRCHLCADSVITDTAGWTEISGVIEADSAYTHIAIGHFLDSTTFVVLPGAPGVGGPYYFVDYVCVVPEGGDCTEGWKASKELCEYLRLCRTGGRGLYYSIDYRAVAAPSTLNIHRLPQPHHQKPINHPAFFKRKQCGGV